MEPVGDADECAVVKWFALALAACTHTAVHTAALASSPAPVSIVASFSPATGYAPRASLVLGPGGSLYGTTWKGINGCGSVYRVDGAGINVMHAFAALDLTGRNVDGCAPVAPVSFNSSGRLYVVTRAGGTGGNPIRPAPGAIVSMLPDGGQVELEHSFTGGVDGASPAGGLVWSGSIAYGSTPQGIYRFDAGKITYVVGLTTPPGPRNPYGSPALDTDGELVAWATYGGANNAGGIVETWPDTGVTRTVYSFPAYTFTGNMDNAPLQSPIVASDGSVWLAPEFGGGNGTGMVIKVERTATVVHEGGPWVATATPTTPRFSSLEGALPLGTLLEYAGWIYGTTYYGGANGVGSIWRIGLDGRGYTTLYSFGGGDGMCYPATGLTKGADGALYGTTFLCGANGGGSIYRFEAPT